MKNKKAKKQRNKARGSSQSASTAAQNAKPGNAQPQKAQARKAPNKSTTNKRNTTSKGRRKLLALALGIPAIGLAGAAIHRHDVNKRSAHDLTSVGAGVPVVVQVHDPSCGLCRSLMHNSKKALKDVPGVLFRIADVTTLDGSDFQSRYGEPNVTLLLFDGKGKLRQTIRGVTPVDELRAAFKDLT